MSSFLSSHSFKGTVVIIISEISSLILRSLDSSYTDSESSLDSVETGNFFWLAVRGEGGEDLDQLTIYIDEVADSTDFENSLGRLVAVVTVRTVSSLLSFKSGEEIVTLIFPF